MRRFLIIVASVIVILGITAAVYFIFFAQGAATLTTDTTNPFQNTASSDTNNPTSTTGNTDTGIIVEGAGKQLTAKFVRITDKPVVPGFATFFIAPPKPAPVASTSSTTTSLAQDTSPDTEIRYIDRASGNVYAYRVRAQTQTRLSNKTIPGIQSASWVPEGTVAFTQYLSKDDTGDEHVETYALPATGEGGYFLEQDLSQITAEDANTILSLVTNSSGSIATLSKADGSGVRTAFSSALSSLVAQFSGKSLFAQTKASSAIPGYGFLVEGKGSFTRKLGPLNGLATLPSPSGKYILYSYTDQGTMQLAILTLATGAITPLPLSTLAEKCVWAGDEASVFCAVPKTLSGNLPDDWYEGAVSFADRIWQVNLTTRLATLVVDPSTVVGSAVDIQNLMIDSKSSVLVFMDRETGSLYAYSF